MKLTFWRLGVLTIVLGVTPLLAQTSNTSTRKKAKAATVPAASQQDVQALREVVAAQQKQIETQSQQVQQLQDQLKQVLDSVQQANANAQKVQSGADQAQATATQAQQSATEAERLATQASSAAADAKTTVAQADQTLVKRVQGVENSLKKVGPFAPNLNAFAERWVLSIRVECLNHFIVFGENHLRHLVTSYLAYYKYPSGEAHLA